MALSGALVKWPAGNTVCVQWDKILFTPIHPIPHFLAQPLSVAYARTRTNTPGRHLLFRTCPVLLGNIFILPAQYGLHLPGRNYTDLLSHSRLSAPASTHTTSPAIIAALTERDGAASTLRSHHFNNEWLRIMTQCKVHHEERETAEHRETETEDTGGFRVIYIYHQITTRRHLYFCVCDFHTEVLLQHLQPGYSRTFILTLTLTFIFKNKVRKEEKQPQYW